MTDWANGIEKRNYGIKRKIDRHMLWDFLVILLSFAMVAGALIFHSWVRNQMTHTGYASQKLLAEEESLLRIQKRLILEEEILKSPERIDAIARNDLGLAPLRPGQMIVPRLQETEIVLSSALAAADSAGADPKKAAYARRSGNYSN